MSKPTVAILGASTSREKFGNKSVRAHLRKGYTVYPVNPRASEVEGLPCYPSIEAIPGPIDRVSFYLPPEMGLEVIELVAAKNPKEVWLNPGTESNALIQRARDLGLNVIVACSIVDLGLTPSQVDAE
ncbi:MAG: CoA-binding protein [Planctomycetota bacterium]